MVVSLGYRQDCLQFHTRHLAPVWEEWVTVVLKNEGVGVLEACLLPVAWVVIWWVVQGEVVNAPEAHNSLHLLVELQKFQLPKKVHNILHKEIKTNLSGN